MLLSVVIPVYNAENTIVHCVNSLQKQTLPPDEILLIENGSNRATVAILRQLARQDSRIKVFTLSRPDIVGALNLGLEKTRGRFVARMDADDICLPCRFEKQVKFFLDNPEIGLLGAFTFGVRDLSDQGVIVTVPTDHESIFRQLRFPYPAGHFLHPTVMFCPERISGKIQYRHGFRYAEDFDLWLRLSQRCKMANFPEPLLRYTLPDSSHFRLRYPYIAFRSCLVSLAEDRLRKHMDSAGIAGKGINYYLSIFKDGDLFIYSVALIGYAINMHLPLKLLLACHRLISRHGSISLIQQCLEAVYPFINSNDKTAMKLWHDFLLAIDFHNSHHKEDRYLREYIHILANTQNWNKNAIEQLNLCTNINQLLNSPAPMQHDAADNILSIFNVIAHTVYRLDHLFDLTAAEGRLGFLGFFLRWIYPNLSTNYEIPDWQIEQLVSNCMTDSPAGPLSLSMLQKAIWLSDSWLQTNFDLNTISGRNCFFEWMERDQRFIDLETEIDNKLKRIKNINF
jgi:glycosyltransferase involved in cell wall biosynthesis